MWKMSEIRDDVEYKIELCQDSHGRRSLRLTDTKTAGNRPDAIFETGVVSNDILRTRDLYLLSEEVRLVDGGQFEFDAHGIWFTKEEMDALDEEREVTWSTKSPPRLAPR